ncbi:hypothetical protein L0F63_003699, partial [Massospora cicadina]
MEALFNTECRPSRPALESLAQRIELPLKNVQIWFQNRRSRARKKNEKLNSSTEISVRP